MVNGMNDGVKSARGDSALNGDDDENGARRRDRAERVAKRRLACAAIAGDDEGLVFAEGHGDALLGVAFIDGEPRAVYDQAAIVRELMRRDGMDRTGALEFFEYNIVGAHVGENGPVFMHRIS